MAHMRIAHVLLLTVLLLPFLACAASFDCSKAVTYVEKQICSNDELSRLDDALATEYQTATTSYESESRVRQDQRRWLLQRNACRSRTCITAAYEKRILELQRANCTRDLATGKCALEPPQKLPRTADGRLLLSTREECRSGSDAHFDGTIRFDGQGDAIRIQADCIEAGIYDPCDDAGGTWGDAQCAWAHMEVAERRIQRAEKRLIAFSSQSKDTRELSEAFTRSRRRWEEAREKFCVERNRRYATSQSESGAESPPDDAEKLGYCSRRLAEERADDLEYFVREAQTSNTRLERTRLLDFLRDDPPARAAQPIR